MTMWVPAEEGTAEVKTMMVRPASPAEIREAARPHADLEAAMDVLADKLSTAPDDPDIRASIEADVREALAAALGADDE